ncbi:MAG: hypothetical protein ACR2HF_11365, partial [Methylococcaceae bacterium]
PEIPATNSDAGPPPLPSLANDFEAEIDSLPQKKVDRALFQSVIDGTVKTADGEGILSPQLADDMEAAFYRNQGDTEMESLFEQAVNAYQDAMLAATADIK